MVTRRTVQRGPFSSGVRPKNNQAVCALDDVRNAQKPGNPRAKRDLVTIRRSQQGDVTVKVKNTMNSRHAGSGDKRAGIKRVHGYFIDCRGNSTTWLAVQREITKKWILEIFRQRQQVVESRKIKEAGTKLPKLEARGRCVGASST